MFISFINSFLFIYLCKYTCQIKNCVLFYLIVFQFKKNYNIAQLCLLTYLSVSFGTYFILENCSLLGYYTASGGNFLPTFRDNLSVPSSEFNNPKGSLYPQYGVYVVWSKSNETVNAVHEPTMLLPPLHMAVRLTPAVDSVQVSTCYSCYAIVESF